MNIQIQNNENLLVDSMEGDCLEYDENGECILYKEN